MPQSSIIPALQGALVVYVDRKKVARGKHQNALPATNDGKFNATGVIGEMRAMGIRLHGQKGLASAKNLEKAHVQHLHKKPELVVRLKALRRLQGLKPLGSPSIVNMHDVREGLAEFLSRLHRSYIEQTDEPKNPTLPLNPASKLILPGLTVMLVDTFKGMHRAAIFKALQHEDIVSEISLVADSQGLLMSEEALAPGDDTARQRMACQTEMDTNDVGSAMASRLSEAKLIEDLAAAYEKIDHLQAKLESFSAEMGHVRSGVFILEGNDYRSCNECHQVSERTVLGENVTSIVPSA